MVCIYVSYKNLKVVMLIETCLESQLPTLLAVSIILYSYMLICAHLHC